VLLVTVVNACNTESTVIEPEAIVKALTPLTSALDGKGTNIFFHEPAAAEAE